MFLEWRLNLIYLLQSSAFQNYSSNAVITDIAGNKSMSFNLVVGDLEPDIIFQALENGSPKNLSSTTSVVLQWLKPDATVVVVALVAVDLTLGLVKYVWSSGDTALPGTHLGRILVTFTNGDVQTFPSDGSSFIWRVHTQLA